MKKQITVPRLLGRSHKMHPLVILLSAVAVGMLAGGLGVLLSTPVVATLRLWLGYIYRKTTALDISEMAYIEQWAARLGLSSLWKEMLDNGS